MPPLRRHQLAHLSATGWRRILEGNWDAEAGECLRHWASRALPLVVTRQHLPRRAPDEPVALGLDAPARWGRRPLALQAAPADIVWLSEFPALAEVFTVLPRHDRPKLQVLVRSLQRHGVRAHVYGTAAWRYLTGLSYLHGRRDLDLWLAVDGAQQADAATGALGLCPCNLRLDGELMFPDGSAVAWREWAAWRAGRCSQVLVKRLNGAALEANPEALTFDWPCTA